MYMYVIYDKVNGNIGKITHMIKNIFPEQMVENGVMTDYETVPATESIKDMDAVPYIDLQTKNIYYEYVAVPPHPQPLYEQVTELKTENETLKNRVSDVEMTITEILFS